MKSSTTAMIVLVYMFLLELGSIAAFGYWGARMNIFAGIGVPLLVFGLWSIFLAPKASIPVLSYEVRTVFKLVVFLMASAALFDSGHRALGTFMLVTSVIDIAMISLMKIHVWNPMDGKRS